ncbi:MAG: hypothetical protein GC179_08400 [Anaerolineaceae bacterium]|nr:hypothetical protein [Anaerolineaceae bacterium]
MNTETALKTARQRLDHWTIETTNPEPNRLEVVVKDSDLVLAARVLSDWGYLSAITGLDLGKELGVIEVLYHFCEGAAVVTLRVRLSRQSASVPTLLGILPSASFYERELHEMFGVTVNGLPDPSYLFLPDDWTKDVYPLRKD